MLKIGIIGAENSHCKCIAKVCNVDKKVPARVVAVWGETAKFAKAAAEAGQIPRIVKDWRDLLGEVDGVMIDHRHAKYHAEVATFYVKNGVPCFVDKPFTFTLAEGKRLCALARKKKVPITSFSAIPLQKNFKALKKATAKLGKILVLNTSGPVDLKSKYGGVFFYGIHQVDTIIDLLGTEVNTVSLKTVGQNGVAMMIYKDGRIVTMNCLSGAFHWSAFGEKGNVDWPFKGDDDLYLNSAKTFVKMFRTGKEPFTHKRLLAPIAVLEAMNKSLRQGGKTVRVAKFE